MTQQGSDFVAFSGDTELNEHLRRAGKKTTIANRTIVYAMCQELMYGLKTNAITHDQLDKYIAGNIHRLG
ncbi:TPA: hypothetical protein JAN03_11705 [Citrobacter freundii]|nr:hypothetical protein [Citrobacter freundii]